MPLSTSFPSSKTNIVSASFILLNLCATTIVVVFSPSLFNDFAMLASVTASKAEVASSNNKIGAGFRNARANAIRCFCPPDNWLPFGPTGCSFRSNKQFVYFCFLSGFKYHFSSSRWISIPNVIFYRLIKNDNILRYNRNLIPY